MSLNASRRWGPLSASSKARPNPVEPRTLGSTHAYPCERKKAVVADQRIRELYAGPPWYETITGSLPERAWAQAGPSTFAQPLLQLRRVILCQTRELGRLAAPRRAGDAVSPRRASI